MKKFTLQKYAENQHVDFRFLFTQNKTTTIIDTNLIFEVIMSQKDTKNEICDFLRKKTVMSNHNT